VIQNS